jgi:glyoxylase-like metal-dependent hydrolase (beta-lactamase superfamily II)
VDLITNDRGGATELVFSRFPTLRDHVAAWQVGDVLVDAGGAHTVGALEAWLEGRHISALVLGHHHEDHSGGASAIARRGVPVFGSRGTAARLRRPGRVPEYRARMWGQRTPIKVRPPDGLPLEPIPLPGHSPDQLGYLDRETGWLYSGDLVLRRRQQVAMPGEDPWAMIDSINRVLELAPAALATSHRGLLVEPAAVLREQRDYLEYLAGEIAQLHRAGLSVSAMVTTLFGGEATLPGTQTTWRESSGGEFSSRRWVTTFLRPRSDQPSASSAARSQPPSSAAAS